MREGLRGLVRVSAGARASCGHTSKGSEKKGTVPENLLFLNAALKSGCNLMSSKNNRTAGSSKEKNLGRTPSVLVILAELMTRVLGFNPKDLAGFQPRTDRANTLRYLLPYQMF